MKRVPVPKLTSKRCFAIHEGKVVRTALVKQRDKETNFHLKLADNVSCTMQWKRQLSRKFLQQPGGECDIFCCYNQCKSHLSTVFLSILLARAMLYCRLTAASGLQLSPELRAVTTLLQQLGSYLKITPEIQYLRTSSWCNGIRESKVVRCSRRGEWRLIGRELHHSAESGK